MIFSTVFLISGVLVVSACTCSMCSESGQGNWTACGGEGVSFCWMPATEHRGFMSPVIELMSNPTTIWVTDCGDVELTEPVEGLVVGNSCKSSSTYL